MKVKSKLPSILSKVKHKTKVVVASALVASLIPFWVFGLIFMYLLSIITNSLLSWFVDDSIEDKESSNER